MQALRRWQRSFALPAPVAVRDIPLVQIWVDLPVNGPLHNAIPKAQRHDEPRLRVAYIKFPIWPHLVGHIVALSVSGAESRPG